MTWGIERIAVDEEDRVGIYDRRVVLRLAGYLTPHWPLLTITFVAIMVYTGTVVALPWIVKWIIDSYILTGDFSGLDLAVVIFVTVAAVQFGSNYVHLRLMAFVGQEILYAMRMDLFSHLQRLSIGYIEDREVGRLMSRLQNDVQQLQEFISMVVLSLADALSLVGIVAVMFTLNAGLALITLSVVPPLLVVLVVWQRFARESFMGVRRAIAVVNSSLQENISGVRVIQSLNREKVNIERFDDSNRSHLEANLEAGRYSSALLPSVEVLMALGLALVVFFGGSMVLEGTLEVGVLVAFALYIQRFFDPIRNLTMQYSELQRAMASGARIFELMDVEAEEGDRPDAPALPTVQGQVRYEGVGFHYRHGTPVLTDVDLVANPGETVAIIGPTGAGKTTLISLLLRLYKPTAGRITVDGHDLQAVQLDSLVEQVGIVLQEPLLFSGTVRDNIRYNHAGVTDDEIVEAAMAVGAHEFISRLSDGYDTPVQERGGNLSQGQRQLISLARALVAKPRILILDEATASVDMETEAVVQRGLRELMRGRTAVVIAHRLSTVRNADLIVVLDEGRVVEQGTHDELMASGGLYAQLQSHAIAD